MADIIVKVPDTFSADEKKQIQEFAAVKIERIIRSKNSEVDETAKTANDAAVDTILDDMGLDKKFSKDIAAEI